MAQIILTIDPQGNPKLETKGFKGSACKLASAFLEKALGTKTADKPTPEAYQAMHNQQIGH